MENSKLQTKHARDAFLPIIGLRVTNLEPTSTKYGGWPNYHKDGEWPSCGGCGHPLSFLFQIDLAELNNADYSELVQVYQCLDERCALRENAEIFDAFNAGSHIAIFPQNTNERYRESELPDVEALESHLVTHWLQISD